MMIMSNSRKSLVRDFLIEILGVAFAFSTGYQYILHNVKLVFGMYGWSDMSLQLNNVMDLHYSVINTALYIIYIVPYTY